MEPEIINFSAMMLFWLFIMLLPVIVIGLVLYIIKNKNKSDENDKFNFTVKDIFTWTFVLFMIFAFVVGAFMTGVEVAEMKYPTDVWKFCEKEIPHVDEGVNYRMCAKKYCENLTYDQYGNPIINEKCDRIGFNECMSEVYKKERERYNKIAECSKKINTEKNFIIAGVAIVAGVILCIIGLLMIKNKPLFIGFFTPLLPIMTISGIILGTDGFFLLLISGIMVAVIIYFRDKVFA